MRPRASLSGTVSVSTCGVTWASSSASAAEIDRRSPPKAKQSSLSCAMSRRLDLEMREDKARDRRRVVERQHRHGESGERRVADDDDDLLVVGAKQGLAQRRPVHLELGMRLVLEALDEQQVK